MSPSDASKGVVFGYAGVVFDLDGVVYLGSEVLPGAVETVAAARKAGVGVAFVTNNASRTPVEVAEKLSAMGIPVEAEEIVTSGQATAELLNPGDRCLVVGSEGLRSVLTDRGCTLVEAPADADAVVVGFTPDLVWDDLRRATLALARGARFLGTNEDPAFPSPEGLWPGNGAVLAALRAASGREPEIAGKPKPPVFRAAGKRVGSDADRVLMVGDRLETDIAGAHAFGWDTALVLTGVTTRQQAEAAEPRPTYVVERVDELLG